MMQENQNEMQLIKVFFMVYYTQSNKDCIFKTYTNFVLFLYLCHELGRGGCSSPHVRLSVRTMLCL